MNPMFLLEESTEIRAEIANPITHGDRVGMAIFDYPSSACTWLPEL
ncbi:MAG: hypothetical protein Q8912_07245 [Bacillota bacterium]|nr:hypothetical protein [Bacillota bacterium]